MLRNFHSFAATRLCAAVQAYPKPAAGSQLSADTDLSNTCIMMMPVDNTKEVTAQKPGSVVTLHRGLLVDTTLSIVNPVPVACTAILQHWT